MVSSLQKFTSALEISLGNKDSVKFAFFKREFTNSNYNFVRLSLEHCASFTAAVVESMFTSRMSRCEEC